MRISSLDGLRAVSIICVLVSHISLSLTTSPTTILVNYLGRTGVNTFFAISGFLITGILLKKELNLKDFYTRRIFRIFPAFYTFLIIMFVAGLSIPLSDFLFASAYTLNYFLSGNWYLAHTWSLAVEEQFYLIFPLTMWVVGKQKAVWLPILAIFLCPLIRLWYVDQHVEFSAFEAVADSIAVGCLLAYFRERLHQTKYLEFLNSKITFLLPFTIISISFLLGFPKYYDKRVYVLFLIPLQNSLIAILIDWCVTKEFRILNWKPVMFIGSLSYSLYLWQQPFMNPGWEAPILVKIALALFFALLSYYLIEQPVLRWRAGRSLK